MSRSKGRAVTDLNLSDIIKKYHQDINHMLKTEPHMPYSTCLRRILYGPGVFSVLKTLTLLTITHPNTQPYPASLIGLEILKGSLLNHILRSKSWDLYQSNVTNKTLGKYNLKKPTQALLLIKTLLGTRGERAGSRRAKQVDMDMQKSIWDNQKIFT